VLGRDLPTPGEGGDTSCFLAARWNIPPPPPLLPSDRVNGGHAQASSCPPDPSPFPSYSHPLTSILRCLALSWPCSSPPFLCFLVLFGSPHYFPHLGLFSLLSFCVLLFFFYSLPSLFSVLSVCVPMFFSVFFFYTLPSIYFLFFLFMFPCSFCFMFPCSFCFMFPCSFLLSSFTLCPLPFLFFYFVFVFPCSPVLFGLLLLLSALSLSSYFLS
jgi:hypothetical protein